MRWPRLWTLWAVVWIVCGFVPIVRRVSTQGHERVSLGEYSCFDVYVEFWQNKTRIGSRDVVTFVAFHLLASLLLAILLMTIRYVILFVFQKIRRRTAGEPGA